MKLSYSDNLTPNEIMKAIYLAHQVEKDGAELLERLGYLRKEKIPKDNDSETKVIIIRSAEAEIEKRSEFQKLDPGQKEQIMKMVKERNEITHKINEQMKAFTGHEPSYPGRHNKKPSPLDNRYTFQIFGLFFPAN